MFWIIFRFLRQQTKFWKQVDEQKSSKVKKKSNLEPGEAKPLWYLFCDFVESHNNL